MDNYTWYVITVETDGGIYADVIRLGNGNNIAQRFNYCATANVCDTKKDAIRIANAWNEQFKVQNRYPKW